MWEWTDDNRLGDNDRLAVTDTVTGQIALWRRADPSADIAGDDARWFLEYQAVRAIGCRPADLRDSELDEIRALVEEAISSAVSDRSARSRLPRHQPDRPDRPAGTAGLVYETPSVGHGPAAAGGVGL